MNIYEKLLKAQVELKAPKGQYNSFGKYKYRSCEDILEALKPVLDKLKLTLFISDEIVEVGGSYKLEKKDETVETVGRKYVKATIILVNIEKPDEIIKTGASSSYARKYALNGMFMIDDTKDSDSTNTHGKDKTEQEKVQEFLNSRDGMIEKLKENLSSDKLEKVLKAYKVEEIWQMTDEQLKEACQKIFKK